MINIKYRIYLRKLIRIVPHKILWERSEIFQKMQFLFHGAAVHLLRGRMDKIDRV